MDSFHQRLLSESNIPAMSILYYTLNNNVFTNFAFYSTASLVKLLGMAAFTSMKRLSRDVRPLWSAPFAAICVV